MVKYKYDLSCGWSGRQGYILVRIRDGIEESKHTYFGNFRNEEEVREAAELKIKQLLEENGE